VSPWKVILATMVIFVCGVVTGALVIRTQGWRPPSASGAGRFPNAGPPGRAPVEEFVRQLKGRLALTTNQCEKIARIMQDSQATNDAIRKRYAPQLQAEVDRAHQAITNLLTSEQQIKYAELLKEQDQRTGGRGDSRGRRGGEGGGFQPRSTNRLQANGLPEDGRPRPGRRGQSSNFSTNDPGNTNRVPSNGILGPAKSEIDGSGPSHIPSIATP